MWWLHSSRSSMFGGLTPLQAVGMLLGSGLISTVVPNLIYIYVLSRQGACPTLVSVLAYSAPAFTALYALLFLGQDLTSDQWLGVVLVCMGTAVIGLGGLSRRV